jgi:hypothetical protein
MRRRASEAHRNALDYFFAYPEDYARTSSEWNQGALERRSHKPAFEVIAVYSQGQGTLDIFFHGTIKTVRDLQVIFARVILIPSCSLTTINDPIEACGGGDQFSIVFQGD